MRPPTSVDWPLPASKAFAISTPMHMFVKLSWEFCQLKASIEAENQSELFMTNIPSYHAFNLAVTAWHMVDWVWAATDESTRVSLREFFQCPDMAKKADLFEAVAKKYRCIHVCGQIANGSKHRTLWPGTDDPDVGVSVIWEGIPLTINSSCGDPLVTYKRHLMIRDGKRDIAAIDVFRETVRTWDYLMGQWGFREGRLYAEDSKPLPWEEA